MAGSLTDPWWLGFSGGRAQQASSPAFMGKLPRAVHKLRVVLTDCSDATARERQEQRVPHGVERAQPRACAVAAVRTLKGDRSRQA